MTEVDNTLERVEKYQSIIDHAARVVLTADLDYATAHAASRRYVFGVSLKCTLLLTFDVGNRSISLLVIVAVHIYFTFNDGHEKSILHASCVSIRVGRLVAKSKLIIVPIHSATLATMQHGQMVGVCLRYRIHWSMLLKNWNPNAWKRLRAKGNNRIAFDRFIINDTITCVIGTTFIVMIWACHTLACRSKSCP